MRNPFKHTHTWIEMSRNYIPPESDDFTPDNVSDRHISKLLTFGFTTIVMRCKTCGEIKAIELTGEHGNEKETDS